MHGDLQLRPNQRIQISRYNDALMCVPLGTCRGFVNMKRWCSRRFQHFSAEPGLALQAARFTSNTALLQWRSCPDASRHLPPSPCKSLLLNQKRIVSCTGRCSRRHTWRTRYCDISRSGQRQAGQGPAALMVHLPAALCYRSFTCTAV